jgi:hypothetical protein
MGLHTGADPGAGIGNTVGPQTFGISGKSATQVDIYNYNKFTIHYTTGGPGGGTNKFSSETMVLTNNGCVFNGQPQWDYEDGFYDGDFDVPYISHTGHHHERHVDGRFGSAECAGKSHKLRYGGGGGSQGKWEFVTHGRVTCFTTANTLNFFAIQGSGSTTPTGAAQIGKGNGGWIAYVDADAVIDGVSYGKFRENNTTYNSGGITAVTTNGVVV